MTSTCSFMFSFLNIRSETRRTSDGAMGGLTQLFLVPDRVPQHDLSFLSYPVVPHML